MLKDFADKAETVDKQFPDICDILPNFDANTVTYISIRRISCTIPSDLVHS